MKAFLRLEAGLFRGAGNADARDYPAKNHSVKTLLDILESNVGKQPEPVRLAVRNLRRELRIANKTRESTKSFQALKGKKGLKVHLGCGQDIRPGWVNIDLRLKPPPESDSAAYPDATFINHDLRHGLPLEEDSCDFVYSSHFFEHLGYEHGLRLMEDCYRALRSGGVFRIVLPPLKDFFEAYLQGEKEYFDEFDPFVSAHLPSVEESGTKTLVDYVNAVVYQRGEHKYIYDEEKLELVLRRIGYSSVAPSSYREGMDPASSIRRRYSFYTEAVK